MKGGDAIPKAYLRSTELNSGGRAQPSVFTSLRTTSVEQQKLALHLQGLSDISRGILPVFRTVTQHLARKCRGASLGVLQVRVTE